MGLALLRLDGPGCLCSCRRASRAGGHSSAEAAGDCLARLSGPAEDVDPEATVAGSIIVIPSRDLVDIPSMRQPMRAPDHVATAGTPLWLGDPLSLAPRLTIRP